VLGYTRIATVATALISGGQYGVSINGTIGSHRYLLFDMAPPVWGAGPRPTFYAVEENDLPPLLSADFEESDGSFTVTTSQGTAWQWGTPQSTGPGGTVTGGITPSTKCWGTGIGNPGFYTNPTVTALRSPVIDLTNVPGARLSFAQAVDLDAADLAVVNLIHATTDEVIASAIHTSTDSSMASAAWAVVPGIDLAAGIGQQVRIEWRFTGTAVSQDFMGWYIDDVVVTAVQP
jgi:hypothetical protein